MNQVLQGIKVIAFVNGLAGPLTAAILASFGAEVIRVESTTRMDWHRRSGPFIGGVTEPDRSVSYLYVNFSVLGVSVNLKHPRADEVLTPLIRRADVILENYAGGVMDRLGLGYDKVSQIKPDIIMLSSSAYGQSGPLATTPGYGAPLTAFTGFPHLTGFADRPPQFPGRVLTDFVAPRINLLAIVAALRYRRRTGLGQYIDAAQVEATLPLITPVLLDQQINRRELSRVGNQDARYAPQGVYRCLGDDQWCAISIAGDAAWQRFVKLIGNPEWARQPGLSTFAGRKHAATNLDGLIEAWTGQQTPQAVAELLQGGGIAAGPVNRGQDLLDDRNLRARQYYHHHELPGIGDFIYGGIPARLSKTPYEIKRAPYLGEHNRRVCVDLLGMSDAEFGEIEAAGVLQ